MQSEAHSRGQSRNLTQVFYHVVLTASDFGQILKDPRAADFFPAHATFMNANRVNLDVRFVQKAPQVPFCDPTVIVAAI
jgi:hypothetical protein